jgi:hypothetical protein
MTFQNEKTFDGLKIRYQRTKITEKIEDKHKLIAITIIMIRIPRSTALTMYFDRMSLELTFQTDRVQNWRAPSNTGSPDCEMSIYQEDFIQSNILT